MTYGVARMQADGLDAVAKDYVELLNSPANAWGQHVHVQYGRSDNMLYLMSRTFGHKEVEQAVSQAFADRRERVSNAPEVQA